MITGPKLFTSPCTSNMPKFITDCWIHVRNEKLVISWKISPSQRICRRSGRSSANARSVYSASPIPDTHCDRIVASAAPATPQ